MRMQRHSLVGYEGIVLVGVFALALGGCGAGTSGASHEQPTEEASALEMMEAVFVGEYSRATIEARMDRALELYGSAPGEREYEVAGSVLVALRKETGVPEMEMLSCMISSHVEGIDMQFTSAAALCATQLSL